MKSNQQSQNEKPFKDLFFVEKVERIKSHLLKFRRQERDDFRRDAKSVLCRGIKEDEVKQVQRGLNLEDTFFYLSRLYIPCAFYYGYKMGIFEDKVTYYEIRRVIRYGINMYLIAAFGHLLLRYYANPVIESHREFSEYELQRRADNDFIVQRNYLKEASKNKRENVGSLLK